jgi:hypothetical protein
VGKSKYEKVFPKLKALPVEDVAYQQIVENVKGEIINATGRVNGATLNDDLVHAAVLTTLDELSESVKGLCDVLVQAAAGRRYGSVFARLWLHVRTVEDHLNEQLKQVRLLKEAYEQLGVTQFEAEGLDLLSTDLGRVQRRPEITIKIHD